MQDSDLPIGSEGLVPLHSLEAEMSTLGSMLLSERAAEEVSAMLVEADFYRPAHRLIFRAMLQLNSEHKPIDFLTLRDELASRANLSDVGGVDYLVQIAEFVPSPTNANFYAQIVLDKSTLRRLIAAGREIIGVANDPDAGTTDDKVDKAERLVFEVGRKQLGKYFEHVRDLAREFFVDVDRIVATKEPLSGLPSGLPDLDALTTGFYPGDFVVIGARPSMGKTSLALDFAVNVARNIVREDTPGSVALFSLEMSGIQLVRRMASMISGVSASVLKTGRISDGNYRDLADGCEILYSLPIYIDDGSDLTAGNMRGKCRRLKAEHGLSLVIIDYLQLMKGSNKRNDNRVNEISEIARGCKAMAKELEVPVIALSQLSRGVESRDDKRPQLSDLRESGSIEAEADLVMLLYRESYYKAKEEHRPEILNSDEAQEAEVIVAKHRNGPTGMVKLGFQPAYARFRQLDRRQGYSAPED